MSHAPAIATTPPTASHATPSARTAVSTPAGWSSREDLTELGIGDGELLELVGVWGEQEPGTRRFLVIAGSS